LSPLATARRSTRPGASRTDGFALLTVLFIVIVVGIIASSGLRTARLVEMLSGSSIQRSRALQAAEGALIMSEREVAERLRTDAIADASGTDKLFSQGSLAGKWWLDATFGAATSVPEQTFLGVITPPRQVMEEIGTYVADGGSGIVSLDRGAAGYGRTTASGRELVLYRLQSHGTGSVASTDAVVESLYVQTR